MELTLGRGICHGALSWLGPASSGLGKDRSSQRIDQLRPASEQKGASPRTKKPSGKIDFKGLLYVYCPPLRGSTAARPTLFFGILGKVFLISYVGKAFSLIGLFYSPMCRIYIYKLSHPRVGKIGYVDIEAPRIASRCFCSARTSQILLRQRNGWESAV